MKGSIPGASSRRAFMQSALAAAASGVIADGVAAGRPPTSPPDADIAALSLSEAAQMLKTRKLSPLDVTRACLARIERLNPKLNAFITVTADGALARAREAEKEIQRGRWRGPLHGIPIGLKDLIDTAGVRTTAGSGLFKERVPMQDASVVQRLKAAGAVLVGKLNLHELAYGGSSAISYFGAVRNPWDPALSPGGSSGGCAAAVATGMCFGAIGSDTGGSIREPAAYCGIVGLKPGYGRVSTSGVIPLSWSLDHLGPMTRTARDAASMLQAIAGYDAQDSGSVDAPIADYAAGLDESTASLRIGVLRDYFYEGLDGQVQTSVEEALAALKTLCAAQLELAPLATNRTYASVMEPYATILTAEAYAYHREYVARSPELYQPQTLDRIRAGAPVSASDYIRALRQLEHTRRTLAGVFADVDLLVTPTVPVPPFSIAALQGDPGTARTKELLMLRNTRPFDFFGLPTVSVPCGFTSAGLPVGLQIAGAPGDEGTVLHMAHAYEQATAANRRSVACCAFG
jgi:aspartyl-tRNA(Asn)/glutamyl-tRNA(Gln) amidotransferase subunit A